MLTASGYAQFLIFKFLVWVRGGAQEQKTTTMCTAHKNTHTFEAGRKTPTVGLEPIEQGGQSKTRLGLENT